jgi:SAM-dependent methyltransferase
MSAEFDSYSRNYEDLLKDPIRDRFTRDSAFFHLRKWLLLQEFFRKRGLSMKDKRWLDVGCGKGELLRLGRSSFREAVGCDPSLEMLGECSNLEVRHQAENGKLPFEDQSADLVTAVCVYHHLSESERHQVTREVRRVLRPDGIFAIFEHNPWNPATRLIVSRTPVDANAVLLTAGETRRLMRDAGMSALWTAYYLYLPESVFRRIGSVEKVLSGIPLGGQFAVFGSPAAAQN